MSIGQNTLNNQAMMDFVGRVEERERAKKMISDEIAVIYAEIKASGLAPSGIRGVVKARKLKPSQFRESEDLRDVYFHAAGLLDEPPLFRSIEALAGDDMSRQAIIDRFAKLVPPGGSIVVEMEGPPVRVARDKDGTVTMKEVIEKPLEPAPSRNGQARTTPRADIPDVDGEAAEHLGRAAFKQDEAIISNPFPFGDSRRPRWDLGWRRESGGDGMGPEE